MALTEIKSNMGVDNRIYVAKVATPTTDADYVRVSNENKFDLKISSKTTETEMKENGGQIVTQPGPLQYELTMEATEVYDDEGLPILKGKTGQRLKLQQRNILGSTDGGDTGGFVEMQGTYIVKDVQVSYEASGNAKYQMTLSGAGDVWIGSRAVGETAPVDPEV